MDAKGTFPKSVRITGTNAMQSTAMPKKSKAEPRSFSTTNMSTAMPQIQMSGAMKRSGASRSMSPEAMALGVQYVSMEELFARSDIVTLHVPLNEWTRGLVSRERIDSMKKSAILINCARGGVVDSTALAEALNEGRIAGAGLDVFESEPPLPADEALLHAKNTVVTPHTGFFTEEAMAIRADIVFENMCIPLRPASYNENMRRRKSGEYIL